MEGNTALATAERQVALTDYAMTPQEVVKQALLVQQVMETVMKDGQHFGIIPGTEKKDRDGNKLPEAQQPRTLFKSGAEKLCFVFGLSPKLEITKTDLAGGHREYQVICTMLDRAGNFRGQGIGCASTMESKHRYRGAAGKTCPNCGASAIRRSAAQYGGGFYCDAKKNGCNAKYKATSPEAKAFDQMPDIRAENQDPADQFNTVLKMAKKRALTDATLSATAASDIFAQDLEDLEGKIDHDTDDQTPAGPKPADPEPPKKTKTTATATTAQPPADEPKKEMAYWGCLKCGHIASELASLKLVACPKCTHRLLVKGNTIEGARQLTQKAMADAAAPKNSPAIEAGMALYNALPAESRGSILKRVCQIHGADSAQAIAPDQADSFRLVCESLGKTLAAGGAASMMADLENMEAEHGVKF